MTDMKFGPWKIHNGGDIPVDQETKVHVQYLEDSRVDALENPIIQRAGDFNSWSHSGTHTDIIAYREVIQPVREVVTERIYWNKGFKKFYWNGITPNAHTAILTCEIVDGVPDWSTLRSEAETGEF